MIKRAARKASLLLMNKRISYFLTVFAILLLQAVSAYAVATNEIAIATIANPLLEKENELQFSINITRTTDEWVRWANGTFQLDLQGTGIRYENLGIELIPDSTDLNLAFYTITPRIVTVDLVPGTRLTKNRISITVLGPQNYSEAHQVFLDSVKPLKVGRFRVFTLDNSVFPLKMTLDWLKPEAYYQACAYKLLNDSIPWHVGNNNIEMRNKVLYRSDIPPGIPTMVMTLCDSTQYIGEKIVKLSWSTNGERNSYGFDILRAKLPFGETDPSQLTYTKIASFPNTGHGTTFKRYNYGPYYDSVGLDRGEKYYYKIISMSADNIPNLDSAGQVIESYCSVDIPYAVIVQAIPMPNPFSDGTKITYKLDDDVYLTATVYDPLGQVVQVLIDNQFLKMGNHEINFQASDFAVQGMYEAVFTAHPINDNSIELSRAVVKLQLSR